MTLFILAYLAGVLTITSPSIFLILPFVLVRADEPFGPNGFPMLIGLAVVFSALASLASIAGDLAVEANRYGRATALAMIILFGLMMLLPALSARTTAPIVSIGSRLLGWAEQRAVVWGVSARPACWASC
jgi:cytochrome c biogenesis protein CcdA